jgi:hypothetical protein
MLTRHIVDILSCREDTYLIPWRDSNPSLLFMRWMRCPLRHATMADMLYFCDWSSKSLSFDKSRHLLCGSACHLSDVFVNEIVIVVQIWILLIVVQHTLGSVKWYIKPTFHFFWGGGRGERILCLSFEQYVNWGVAIHTYVHTYAYRVSPGRK